MRMRRLLVTALIAGQVGWSVPIHAQNAVLPTSPTDPRDPLLNQGPKSVAVGDKVMVSTQLPIVTETALKVLREGGNAFDAFITAVFLQNVVDYHQVSLFG